MCIVHSARQLNERTNFDNTLNLETVSPAPPGKSRREIPGYFPASVSLFIARVHERKRQSKWNVVITVFGLLV